MHSTTSHPSAARLVRILRPTALLAAGALSLASAQALTFSDVQFGGFVSQGFLVNTGPNDYLGETSEGTFDFREYAANVSYATGSFRFGAQAFGQKLGEYGDDEILLDWATVDWQPKQWFGVRAGRVKMPRGLYNEALDLDSVRPFVLLPQSVYDARLRDFNASFDGGMIYGNVSLGSAGSIDYRIFYGEKEIDLDSGATDYFNSDFAMPNGPMKMDAVYGASIFWDVPVPGLRLGYSFNEFENLDATRWFLGMEFLGAVKKCTDKFPRHVLSAEYIRGDWVFAAEASWENADYFTVMELNPTDPMPIYARNENYYVSAARRINDWLEVGAYYSYFHKTDVMPPTFDFLKEQDDFALSARFDVNEHVLVKFEVHHLQGNGKVFEEPRDIFTTPPPRDDRSWTLFAAKATYTF